MIRKWSISVDLMCFFSFLSTTQRIVLMFVCVLCVTSVLKTWNNAVNQEHLIFSLSHTPTKIAESQQHMKVALHYWFSVQLEKTFLTAWLILNAGRPNDFLQLNDKENLSPFLLISNTARIWQSFLFFKSQQNVQIPVFSLKEYL